MEEKPQKPRKNPASTLQSLLWYTLIAACVKLLLITSYQSTDFEVHRNWLAITHSFPLSQWYSDETSPWTLDYPPFFAYLGCFLSIFANLVDTTIARLRQGLSYSSNTVVYFRRITVTVSDLCLFFHCIDLGFGLWKAKSDLGFGCFVSGALYGPCAFSVQGFLLGISLLFLSFLEEGRDLMGGFLFAILLCFKHLLAVAAPVYFVYLLSHFCHGGLLRSFRRVIGMGAAVALVFVATFGPFVYYGQVTYDHGW